jgi:hypothetical protein
MPPASKFNKISKREAVVEQSVVSDFQQIGIYQIDICVEMIVVNRYSIFDISKCWTECHSKIFFSSHVEVLERIPPHMNTKTGPLTKGHNSYPWESQQTVGRSDHQKLQKYCPSIFLILVLEYLCVEPERHPTKQRHRPPTTIHEH